MNALDAPVSVASLKRFASLLPQENTNLPSQDIDNQFVYWNRLGRLSSHDLLRLINETEMPQTPDPD